MGREGLRESVVLAVLLGEETDAEVISSACSLARRKGAQLRGLYVLEVPRTVPLGAWDEEREARARSVLEAARKLAEQWGCSLECRVLPARHAGQAIVDEAVEWSALSIVMAKPHSSQGGDAASYVLEKAVCAVLVWQPALEERCRWRRSFPSPG